MYLIGIDGGGTSTEAILYHAEKGEQDRLSGQATNPNNVGFQTSVSMCLTLIRQLIEKNRLTYEQLKSVGIGMSGLGQITDQQRWFKLFKGSWPDLEPFPAVKIDHDAKTALYAGTNGLDGMCVISGTGSIGYGLHRSQEHRVGGWGHLIGSDRGSVYYLGFRGLDAVFLAYDKLGPRTCITKFLLEKFQINEVPELISHIYQQPNSKKSIARIAEVVCQAAEQGDRVAREIIRDASQAIAEYSATIYTHLFHGSQGPIPLILVGGLFKNELLYNEVKRAVQAKITNVTIKRPDKDPVYGAIILAQQAIQS